MADGAQRRSITGSSSASSSYPIPEAYEHKSQMGDLSIYQDKPVITVSDTTEAHINFKEFVEEKKLSKSIKSEFAKSHYGLSGDVNPTGIDISIIYPPLMHRVINSLGSICLPINTIGKVLLKKDNNWLEQIKPYARKIDEQNQCIK